MRENGEESRLAGSAIKFCCKPDSSEGGGEGRLLDGSVLGLLHPVEAHQGCQGVLEPKSCAREVPCLPRLGLSWFLLSLEHSVIGWEELVVTLTSPQTLQWILIQGHQLCYSWWWRHAFSWPQRGYLH